MGMENHTPTCLQAPLLNTEKYIRNMKWLAQHGFRIIFFTGGEPLLNPDFACLAEEMITTYNGLDMNLYGECDPDWRILEKYGLQHCREVYHDTERKPQDGYSQLLFGLVF